MSRQATKTMDGTASTTRTSTCLSVLAGRPGATPRHRLSLSVSAAALCAGLMPLGVARAQTLPTGGTVASGTATIGAPQAGALTINQSSQRAVINWDAFSVGQGGRVTFQQPGAGAATLNRVTGSTGSTIAGQIQANGQVYLVNPNGILITPTGTVDTAGFTASTLDTTDGDFMAGRRRFTGNGHSAGVTNQGTIRVRGGGDAVLIGGRVTNEGTIAAPGGRVGLAAGEAVSVDVEGDGFLTVSVPSNDPDRTQALIRQTGRIRAQGGRVEARAATSADVARAAIQLGGSIEAGGIARTADGVRFGAAPPLAEPSAAARPHHAPPVPRRNGLPSRAKPVATAGTVVVDGGAGGAVSATGRIDASSPTSTGGAITITGRIIDLAGARLDASGATGGGQIRIGGDYQGSGPLPHARTVSIDAATTIRADALRTGDGGRIIVWSDQDTNFAGTISAQGGAQGGNGGFAEVSSKGLLDFSGMADMRAALGRFGTLLLDPYNIVISNAADAGQGATTAGGTTTFTPTGTSVIKVATLQAALNSANVTITTGGFGSAGAEAGDITVASAIAWSSANSLTLSAYRNITINGAITNSGGANVNLRADNSGLGSGTVSFGTGIQVSTAGAVSVYYNPTSNPPTGTPSVNGTSYTTGTDYSGNIAGGGSITGYMLVNNVYDLQNVRNNLSGAYALGRDIDASVTSTWNSGAGFLPIGNLTFSNYTISGSYFGGIFDGQNQAISNLTINRPSTSPVGLFSGNAGQIRNLGVIGGTITGYVYVGGLVGQNYGNITNSFSSATISGWRYSGGLVGYNTGGTIRSSYSTSSVTNTYRGQGFGGDGAGGLVGYNGASIVGSYAAGAVSGEGGAAGGLVGNNNGSISQSYATGSVFGYVAGGLVGANSGPITQTYATGAVSATYNPQSGGLVGYDVSGGASVTNSYWDIQTTGRSNGIGAAAGTFQATGLTTAQFANSANMPGLTFGTTPGASGFVIVNADGTFNNAGGVNGATRPFLLSEYSTSIANAHQLQLMSLAPTAAYTLMRNIDLAPALGSSSGNWLTSNVLGDGYGFVPIGSANQFQGVFDGGNHTISNLSINRGDAIGLFGTIWAAGTVKNLGVVNATVAGGNQVGAIAARNDGTLTNVYSTGTISGTQNVGGLVGNNIGTISRSYSTASVTATGSSVGGLVGQQVGTISQSYAGGPVSGLSSVGGLAGFSLSGAMISDAYATGTVSGLPGSSKVGGLVGYNQGTITRTYAAGSVSGSIDVGGLVGNNSAVGSVTSSFWDTTTTGMVQGYGSNLHTFNATGLTTAQLQDLSTYQATFGGWDFQGVWAPPNQVGQNNGSSVAHYPELYAFLTVLTIAPNNISRFYGDINPTLTTTYYGNLKPGDSISTMASLFTSAGQFSNVGDYAITASGAAVTSPSGNTYRIVYIPGALTVTGRPLTITADAKNRVYGAIDPTLTYQITSGGLLNGDQLTGSLTTVASSTTGVGSYAINQGTLGNSNYAITYVSANETIGARQITVTADTPASRHYGDANPALTYTIGGLGLVNGDSLAGALATSATSASGVGSYAITQGSLGNPNYQITGFTAANLSVTARPITVTADAQTRHYGDANPTLTYTVGGLGMANGDTLGGALATSATTASGVGSYSITAGTLGDPNYQITTFTSASLSVTARPITVTADAKSRIYGDANPVLSWQLTSGSLVNGDNITGGLATSATGTSNVGSYAITQGDLAASANYAVTYAGANLGVTQRAITVSADAQSRVYGNANPALTWQLTAGSLVNGDNLTGNLATTATGTSNVGSYAITQGDLAASSNYAVTYVGANLAVSQRAITVSADAQSRIYGNANPALTWQLTSGSLVNGDNLTGGLATSATSTSNVGSYAITQGDLAASSNYAVTYVGANLGVTQRAITVAADAQGRIYGDANPALTWQLTSGSLVNGDNLTGGLATSATGTSNVGSYAITQGSLTASSNYAVTYVGANLWVGQRAVTVSADAQSRVYGDTNPALTWQLTAGSLVNGDAITGGLATSATGTSNVGSYAITQGTLAASSNYAVTYVGANLGVTQRAITVSADALSRVYGDTNPALTWQLTGGSLVNGDTITGGLATTATGTSNVGSYAITQGNLTASSNYAVTYVGANLAVSQRAITVAADAANRVYGDANPALTWQLTGGSLVNGDSLTGSLATSATGTSNVGSYAITQGSLGNGNYAVTYVGANLGVSQRSITITADAKSRVYGDANPALTYGVGGMGLVNGDALAGTLATSATAASGIGGYAITQGTLANANYAIAGFTGATLTVTPRPVTITAVDGTKNFGQADPALTYLIGGMGLANGDQVTGALAREAGDGVGTYAILQGSVALSANYLLTFQPGRFTVSPLPAPVAIGQLATLSAPPPAMSGAGGSTVLDGLGDLPARGWPGMACQWQPSGGIACQ